MLLVDDLAAGGTKNLRHTPRGLVTLLNDLLKLEKKFFSQWTGFTNDDYTGIPQAVEIMENLEKSRKKTQCMEKSWNLKKLNNHGKTWNFVK